MAEEEKNEPSGKVYAIDRKLVCAFIDGLISDGDERKKALEYIRSLPLVDHQETITEFADRCRECGAKYGKLLKQKQKGGVMTYGNGEMPNGGWTPISEGTPKENETVIASTEYGVFPEARYSKEYGWEWAYEAGADYWSELENVEAWMPLPKRYKPQIESEVEE